LEKALQFSMLGVSLYIQTLNMDTIKALTEVKKVKEATGDIYWNITEEFGLHGRWT
jgi:hypothetical protein